MTNEGSPKILILDDVPAIETQTVDVDWRSIDSIEKAERKKIDLECEGYTLLKTETHPIQWNVTRYIYRKETTFKRL